MNRPDGRKKDQIRPVNIIPYYIKHAEGSVLIEVGQTRVLCNATVEATVPPHLKGTGTGWVTAEYALLPRSTGQRTKRERGALLSGRTQEIQRLIGRALRSVTNLQALGEQTITLDCDVLQADGGTRTVSVTGAFIALCMAAAKAKGQHARGKRLVTQYLASTSVGIVNNEPCLDLCYEEDFHAEVDMNVVMVESGDFVEIQGTGEETTFSRGEVNALLDLAHKGIMELIGHEKKIIGELP